MAAPNDFCSKRSRKNGVGPGKKGKIKRDIAISRYIRRYIVDILSHFCDISTIYYEIYRKNEIIYWRYIAIYRRYIKIYRKKLVFLRYIAYITLFLYFDISHYIEFRYIRKFSLIYLEIYENLIYIDISFKGILYHFMKLIDIFP